MGGEGEGEEERGERQPGNAVLAEYDSSEDTKLKSVHIRGQPDTHTHTCTYPQTPDPTQAGS